jgi:hypothetical protein
MWNVKFSLLTGEDKEKEDIRKTTFDSGSLASLCDACIKRYDDIENISSAILKYTDAAGDKITLVCFPHCFNDYITLNFLQKTDQDLQDALRDTKTPGTLYIHVAVKGKGTTSHHITSHHITSHHITSHHITSQQSHHIT